MNKRKESPIETTGQLIEVIKGAIPMKVRAVGGHPAKKTFQAIRIECNRELDVLKDSIDAMIDLLNPGGRLCIITFHSLEDRIVKRAFKKMRILVHARQTSQYVYVATYRKENS